MVVTVHIDVLSRSARRAKAAARELSSALAQVSGVSVEGDVDSETPHIAVYYVLHTPKKPIAAAIIAAGLQHPKTTIKVSQGPNFIEINGESSEEQSRHLSELLGEHTD